MKAFQRHTGVVVPLDRADVDTDLIIPARFLKRVERTGYGDMLFYTLRFNPDGSPRADSPFAKPEYRDGTILVAGPNFGCGSSREHAPWALLEYGFHVVVAPSFANIFAANAQQNGLLTVVLPEERVREMLDHAAVREGYQLTVDLERQVVTDGFGRQDRFEIDGHAKHCLLNGLDAIGLTLRTQDEITRFEAGRPRWMPRVTV